MVHIGSATLVIHGLRFMSRALILLLVFSIVLPLSGFGVASSSSFNNVLEYSLSYRVVIRGGYSVVVIDNVPSGMHVYYSYGEPAIPVLKALVLTPYGYTIDSIKIHVGGDRIVRLDKPLLYTPKPRPLYCRTNVSAISRQLVRANWRYLVERYWWRGVEYAVLTIRVVDYIDDYTIKEYSILRISIEYRKIMYVKPLDPEIYKYISTKCINRHDIARYGEPVIASSNEKTALILTREVFLDTLRGYIEFREKQGYNVIVATVEDIVGSGISGRDIPEKIRNYIYNLYIQTNGGLKYLLIIGDVSGETGWPNGPYNLSDLYEWEVPTRYFYNPDGTSSYSHTGDYTPSDWYYAALDTNWDSDGDGVYGEVGNDTCDWAPEIAVSRLPFRDTYTLEKYLDAVMSYNKTSIGGMLNAGAIVYYFNQNGGGDYGSQGDTALEAIWDKLKGYSFFTNTSLVRLYEHYPVYTVIDEPSDINGNLSEANMVSSIYSYKPDIIAWFAHGWKDSVWRMIWSSDDGDGVPEDSEMSWTTFLYSSDLDDSYGYVVGLVMAMSCLTAYYDAQGYDCLGEAFVKTNSLWYIGWDRVTWVWLHLWDWLVNPDEWGGLADGYMYRILRYLAGVEGNVSRDIGYSILYTKWWSSTVEPTDDQAFRKVWWASTLIGDLLQPIAKANTVVETVDAIDTYNGSMVHLWARLELVSGEPLAGKKLYLIDSNGSIVASNITDSNGYTLLCFKIDKPGTYRYKVLFDGSQALMPSIRYTTVYVSPRPSNHWILLLNTTDGIESYSVSASDGYLYVTSVLEGYSKTVLSKVNLNGSIAWSLLLNTGSECIISNALVYNDSLYVAGYTITGSTGARNPVVAKISLNGSLVWSKVFSDVEGYIASITINDTDTYVLGTITGSDYGLFVAKINSSGLIEWFVELNTSGDDVVPIGSHSIVVYNGYLYLTGFTNWYDGLDYDVIVYKLYGNGSIALCRVYRGAGDDFPSSMIVYNNSLYIIGYSNSYGVGYDTLVMCIDVSTGDIDWARILGGNGDDYGVDIHVVNDTLYLVGYTNSYGSGGYDAYIAQLTLSGEPILFKVIGASGDEYVSSSCITSDPYLIVTGYTNSYRGYGMAGYVLLYSNSIGEVLLWSPNAGLEPVYVQEIIVVPTTSVSLDTIQPYTGFSRETVFATTYSIDSIRYSIETISARDNNFVTPISEPLYPYTTIPVIVVLVTALYLLVEKRSGRTQYMV